MANGLKVIQAAMAGHEVQSSAPYFNGAILHWDPTKSKLVDRDGHANHVTLDMLFAYPWEILDSTWPIEEPILTFGEADLGMVNGRIAECRPKTADGDVVQYRVVNGTYEMRFHGPEEGWSSWKETMIGFDDIHRATWRLMPDEIPDERPTIAEITEFLFGLFTVPSTLSKPVAVDMLLEQVYKRWPAMFREENTNA